MGTAFPFFTNQLYHNLTFHWGGTLIALIAAALAPIPIVLLRFGPSIRARSKFASALISTEGVRNETELAGKEAVDNAENEAEV